MFGPQMMSSMPGQGGMPNPNTLPPEPVPRVKPKHGYEWYQDKKVVKIRIPMKGITMKKIDLFVSDVVVKINITEKRWVRIIDLKHEVQFLSKETTVVYANDFLEITLLKEDQSIHWEDLVEDSLDKEQIKSRRAASFARKEQADLDHIKHKNDLKVQYDTHATKEMMRLEDEARKNLENLKTNEKNQALNAIFNNVDKTGKFGKEAVEQQQQKNEDSITTLATTVDKSGSSLNVPRKIEFQPEIIWTHKYDDSDFYGEENSMFGEQDLLAVEYIEKPKVREQTKLDIGFTQRMYPGVAMREQHLKDAPMPKIKQAGAEKSGDDLENKNPLWLKDRGDEFYKNQDFLSAIMAYNQAFKIDPTMIVCIANRCACNIQLFNYEETLIDANRVLQHIEELPKDDKDTPKNAALRVKTLLRKAIATSWKGEIQDSLQILQKCLDEDIFVLKDCGVVGQFEDAVEKVLKRKESIIVKKQGDTLFKEGQFEEALQRYLKSMDMDGNETAVGNVSLTYLKLDKNAECIEFCDRGIKKVQTFTRFSIMNPLSRQSAQDSNAFLVKLYLRKAKAQQNLKMLKEAFETVKQAIQINDKNSEAKEIHKSIEKSFLLEEVSALKAQAAAYVKENRISEALEVYNECLKKIDSATDTIEFLGILLNRSVCFLKTEQYGDIVTTCLRGLKIIRSFKNRVISWTSQKLSKEDKEKLVSFESRFLVRRANAYVKQNLIFNAKQDLDDALKLDPNNEQIKQDILKLRQQ